MPVEFSLLESALKKHFNQEGDNVELKSLVDDGDHYQVTITSTKFEGKNRIEMHRMVNNIITENFGDKLHALSIIIKIK